MTAGAIYLLGMFFIFSRLIKEHRITFRPLVQVGSNYAGSKDSLANGNDKGSEPRADWKSTLSKVMENLQYWNYAKEISCKLSKSSFD
jgi:hypothetical protein